MTRKIFGLSALIFVLLPILAVEAQTARGRIPFSGTAPGFSGPQDLTFILYDADTGGSALYADSQTGIDVTNQPFPAVLGAGNGGDVPAVIFAANPSVFIAIEMTSTPGTEIAPRVAINSSGYAHNAATLGSSVFTDSSGNVGIATTPRSRFHVNGTSWFQGDTASAIPPSAGKGIAVGFNSGSTGGYLFAFDYAAGTPQNLFLNHFGGNVGIGTTSPGAKLEVLSSNDYGVLGTSSNFDGVSGVSTNGAGVAGNSANGTGVIADSLRGNAIIAELVNSVDRCEVSTPDSCNLLRGKASGVVQVRIDRNGRGFFNGGTQTGGADFAESMEPARDKKAYEPGDVLVIDPDKRRVVSTSSESYSTRVAGIYSTKPGVLATAHKIDDPRLTKEIPMALVGIVPTKVSAENGPIKIGDLLVTSSTPGHAMKGTDRSRMLGAIVGKALEPLASGKGVIQVLMTLQ